MLAHGRLGFLDALYVGRALLFRDMDSATADDCAAARAGAKLGKGHTNGHYTALLSFSLSAARPLAPTVAVSTKPEKKR